MVDNLNEFLEDINSRIATSLPTSKVTYYEEARIQEQNGKSFPMVNLGSGRGEKISPSSRHGFQTYHRIIDSSVEVDPAGGYGKKPYRLKIYTMRNVWIGSRKLIKTLKFEQNDGLLNEVINAFPVVLTNKQRIRITDEQNDKTIVFEEEFPGINLEKLTLDLFAFYITYELRVRVIC